ncbi:MAG: zinc ribbon domain-containing protein [Blastocatellia bacterium]
MSKEVLSTSCPNCTATVSAESRFCINCRHELSQSNTSRPPTVLEQVCPKCKAGVGQSATFCGNCGASLDYQARAQAGEFPLPARAILAVVAIAFLIIIFAGSNQPRVAFREAYLSSLPADSKPGALPFLSFNRAEPKVAYSAKDNDQPYVYDGDRRLRDFDSAEKAIFNRDGSRFAYVAKDDRKAITEFVVVDGRRGPAVEGVGTLSFSPDGRIVYGAKLSDKWSIYIEHEKGPTYDSVYYPVFARDAKTITYIGRLGDKYVAVTDGKQGEMFDDISFPVNSRYGTTVAYRARQNGKWFVVVNDKKGPAFDSIEDGPAVSEDGGKIAYVAYESPLSRLSPERDDGLANIAYQSATSAMRKILMIGDKRQELDYSTTIYGLLFNPEGSRVAYKVRKYNKYYVMDGDKKGPEYDLITALVFTPDGSRVAYAAYQSGKGFIVVGDTNGPAFDEVYPPSFSPDGSQIAFVAKKADKRMMIIGDVSHLTYSYQTGPECDVVYFPLFSIDGSSVAYGAVQGQSIMWKVMSVNDVSPFSVDK